MTSEDEWATLLLVGFGLWWLTRHHEDDARLVPMPDWHDPKYEGKEIEISPRRTQANFDQMRNAYLVGYKRVTGDAPPNRMLAMLLAQSAFETAEWQSMFEWNPANLTMTGKRGFFYLGTDRAHKYSPYPDAATGAGAHVAALGRRFPKSMGLMLTAEPEAVAAMLKQEGFYEGPANTYAAGMRRYFNKFAPLIVGPVT